MGTIEYAEKDNGNEPPPTVSSCGCEGQGMIGVDWVIGIGAVALVAGAIVSRRAWVYGLVATILLLALFLGCTFVFETDARGVVDQAHRSGEFSKDFLLGIQRLKEGLFMNRAFSLLVGISLFVLVVSPAKPRSK